MNVLISADMEGICGVTDSTQIRSTELDPRWSRLFSEEVETCAEALMHAGATVTVCDAHGIGENLALELLPSVQMLLQGPTKPLGMMQGIENADAAVLIGYHGMSQDVSVMHHTHSSTVWPEVRIDGADVGEVGINVMLARAFGVPVLFLAGTDAAVDEARGVGVRRTCITKWSLTKDSCKHRNREEVFDEYRACLGSIDHDRTDAMDGPRDWNVRFLQEEQVLRALGMPGVNRTGEQELSIEGAGFIQQYRRYYQMIRMLSAEGLTR